MYLVVHAAVNAIINKTRESIEHCIMYVTYPPDKDCVHAIKWAGIRQVIYSNFRRVNAQGNLQQIVQRANAILEGTCELT